MQEFKLKTKDGKMLILRAYDKISPDHIYRHYVEHEVYNLITSENKATNIDDSVVNSFLYDLRRRK